MKTAYMFPGQGSQSNGMGKELYDNSPAARAVFDQVDTALGQKLSALIFDGDAAELNLTQNTQPAIFAVSMADWAARTERGEIDTGAFVLGHSLGEYAALSAAGCFGVADGARLLRRRGELMAAAVPVGVGAMAAIIGIDEEVLEEMCEAASKPGLGDSGLPVCEIANDNGGGQFVISGDKAAVESVVAAAQNGGAKIAKVLPITIPAHSTLMEVTADDIMKEILAIEWSAPKFPFISNKTANLMPDLDDIKMSLVYQMSHGVRWRECVLKARELGVTEFIEVGPGTVLTGLVKRIM